MAKRLRTGRLRAVEREHKRALKASDCRCPKCEGRRGIVGIDVRADGTRKPVNAGDDESPCSCGWTPFIVEFACHPDSPADSDAEGG